MGFFDMFSRKPKSAAIAKDRLQIIVARERRANQSGVPYLAQLQQELLAVVAKYEKLDLDMVTVNVEQRADGEVLELNVVIPEDEPELPPRPTGKGGKKRKKKKRRGGGVHVGKLAHT